MVLLILPRNEHKLKLKYSDDSRNALRSNLEGFFIIKIPHHEDEGLSSKLLTDLQHYVVGVVLPTVDASTNPFPGFAEASDSLPSLST